MWPAQVYAKPVILISRKPSPQLSPYVSFFWYFAGPALMHERERMLPTIGLQLLVNLHEDIVRWWDGAQLNRRHGVNGAAVRGMHTRPVAICARDQIRIVGAVLRPSAAGALLGVPAHELAETHTALDALWGAHGRSLREQLLEAPTPDRCMAILDRALCARLAAQLDPAIDYACRALESGSPVASVADTLSIDRKRLRRTFAAAVGITPKGYARVARLQRLLTLIRQSAGRPLRWAELASECGYYDQAHLILEFRSLTGLTPSAYRPRTPDEPNHVLL